MKNFPEFLSSYFPSFLLFALRFRQVILVDSDLATVFLAFFVIFLWLFDDIHV